LAHTHLAAGRAGALERSARLAHLHSALALFTEMEVARLSEQAQDAIRALTSPPPVAPTQSGDSFHVITRSSAVREVLADLDRFKNTHHTILLEGETGAGKDLMARYVHYTSDRSTRPFVQFNAAAVPEALAESELFGHVRGSFTGAMRDREGLLFSAKNGTFFFNEIGEAPLAFQAKLLTVIESRRSRPVGSNVERPIEARLIFATNRDLQDEIDKGAFRKDLYFRLATARLRVPPLRERPADVDPLLTFFLQNEQVDEATIRTLRQSPEWSSLKKWRWDGNVRELHMFAQRLSVEIHHDRTSSTAAVLKRLMSRVTGRGGDSESVEKDRIAAALEKHAGNKRRAAAELRMPESTLRWKIKNLGLDSL
jgi:transcriptional regulator with GAF, ATPase, and Fis domain